MCFVKVCLRAKLKYLPNRCVEKLDHDCVDLSLQLGLLGLREDDVLSRVPDLHQERVQAKVLHFRRETAREKLYIFTILRLSKPTTTSIKNTTYVGHRVHNFLLSPFEPSKTLYFTRAFVVQSWSPYFDQIITMVGKRRSWLRDTVPNYYSGGHEIESLLLQGEAVSGLFLVQSATWMDIYSYLVYPAKWSMTNCARSSTNSGG